eukprot:4482797-Pleurochrysis_carterae.AAC.1
MPFSKHSQGGVFREDGQGEIHQHAQGQRCDICAVVAAEGVSVSAAAAAGVAVAASAVLCGICRVRTEASVEGKDAATRSKEQHVSARRL